MVNNGVTPSVYGAGGKLKKNSVRKRPSTPYDRPAQSRNWVSKLASKILPSFFPASSSLEYNDPEEEENPDEENKSCPSNYGQIKSVEGTNPSEEVETLNNGSDGDRLGPDKRNSSPGGTGFSKIEQLVKERQFSRDDVNRLVELLHSQVAEASNIEPVGEKPLKSVQRQGEGSVMAFETPMSLFKGKQESLNVAGLGTPIPLFQSNVEEKVAASPIDLARAYMGNRVSEVSSHKGTISKYGGDSVRSDKYASQSLVPSPSPKTLGWPGAMTEDRYGHSTPQNVSRRYGLHQFQRSPYSRSLYSKSKSKLARPEAESNRFQTIPPSTRLHSQPSTFGQREHTPNDMSGSVGPIRRFRRNFLSEASPRGSISCHSSQNGHSPASNTNSFLPTTKNLDSAALKATTEFRAVGPTLNCSEAALPAFQTSNPTARAILEHLDRHMPTPKERSAELQLATSPSKNSFFKSSDTVPKEGNDRAKSNFQEIPHEISEATNADTYTKSSTTVNGKYDSHQKSPIEMFSFGLSTIRAKNTGNQSTCHSQNEGQIVTNTPLDSTILESEKRPPHHPYGSKPNLASISVDKPHLRRSVLSDSRHSGFTFSVSSPSSALLEPPTPSVMPFNITGSPPKPKNDFSGIPKYTFGDKRSTPNLKFSFPSTSNASPQDEVSDLKFSFGAGNKSRLSFKSVDKDAICY